MLCNIIFRVTILQFQVRRTPMPGLTRSSVPHLHWVLHPLAICSIDAQVWLWYVWKYTVYTAILSLPCRPSTSGLTSCDKTLRSDLLYENVIWFNHLKVYDALIVHRICVWGMSLKQWEKAAVFPGLIAIVFVLIISWNGIIGIENSLCFIKEKKSKCLCLLILKYTPLPSHSLPNQ